MSLRDEIATMHEEAAHLPRGAGAGFADAVVGLLRRRYGIKVEALIRRATADEVLGILTPDAAAGEETACLPS